MDPLSLLVGAMAGACFTVVIMSLMSVGDDDDYRQAMDETDDAPQHEGGLILPDDRTRH